jgi:hypothetical protein
MRDRAGHHWCASIFKLGRGMSVRDLPSKPNKILTCNKRQNQDKLSNKNRVSKNKLKNKQVCTISTKSANCVRIQIEGQQVNALLDSGADVSVIRTDMFHKIKRSLSLELNKSSEVLRNASGKHLKLLGETEVKFQIGSQILSQKCHVTPDIRVPLLLGTDFMKHNDVTIWISRGQVTINGEILPLRHYDKLSNLVRLVESTTIPPQTAITTWGKIRQIDSGTVLCLTQAEHGFMQNEPGLTIMNTVGTVVKNKYVPMTIVNATGREFFVTAGCVLAQSETIDESDINNIDSIGTDNLPDLTYEDVKNFKLHSEMQLTPEEVIQFEELIHKNSDVFGSHKYDLGRTELVKFEIDTGDHPPVKKSPYRTPYAFRGQVKQQISEMLKADIIQPSQSDWAAPIICVPKKGTNEIRIVVDHRGLNDITKKINWPLTQIEDSFNALSGAKYLSSLDLLQGYHQLPISAESMPKTAFICEEGLYEYKVMSFGLCNSPAAFSELMSKVLHGIEGAFAYLDDILLFSRSFQGHCQLLQDVFNRLRSANLKLKLCKCQFLRKQLNYLGHSITEDGIGPDESKVKAIKELERPKTVRDVRSFIGSCSYYRKFVPNFAKLAYPLTQLTKKHAKFEWSHKHQEAFEKLKQALISAPILQVPNFEKEFTLFTDASNFAIGAVLTQLGEDGTYMPIAYLSHQLNKTQQNWATIEKEAYSIVYALKKWRHYLYGRPFKIFSDHKPLKYIHSAQMRNAKLQRWALEISGYGGSIEYIKGSNNIHADLLSRVKRKVSDSDMDITVINSDKVEKPDMTKPSEDTDDILDLRPIWEGPTDIKDLQKADSGLQKLGDDKHYIEIDDTLYYIARDETLRLVIPRDIQADIIQSIHEGPLGSHIGRDKTYEKIHARYFWEGMTKDVYAYVNRCTTCKEANLQKREPPMQETTVPQYPFEMIALDFAGPYPETEKGDLYVLTVVDLFTGWVIPIPVPDKTAETTAKIIMEHVIPSHAVPLRILTDRGGEFRNKIIEELCDKMQIGHIQTSPFSPQANGRCERSHRAMTACLSKMCGKSQTDWDTCLPAFSSAYNTSKSSATGFSAFYLLYGRDPVLPVDTILKPRRKYLGEDYFPQALERMHIAYRVVRKHLHKQSDRNKQRKKTDRESDTFKVGDPVYLKNNARANKLQKRWLSHFRIIAQRGPVSFTLKNQLTGKIREAHAKDLRLAGDQEMWTVTVGDEAPRRATLVIPESDSESGESGADSHESDRDSDQETIIYDYGDGPILSPEGPDPGQGSSQEVTTPDVDKAIDTPACDLNTGDIPPSETPDQSGQVSDDSEWSDEDNIPLAELRQESLNKRKTREAKAKANEKLKRLKEILCLVSELA